MEININKLIISKIIWLIIFLLITLHLKTDSDNFKNNKNYKKEDNNLYNNLIINNNEAYSDCQDFIKYRNMLPYISQNSDSYNIPLKKDDLFHARQIIISDARITPDYIKFIRSINEKEELKLEKNSKKKKL